jgi:hypothetical protein
VPHPEKSHPAANAAASQTSVFTSMSIILIRVMLPARARQPLSAA